MARPVRCCRLAAAGLARGGLGDSLNFRRSQTQKKTQSPWHNRLESQRANGLWAPPHSLALSTTPFFRGSAKGPDGPQGEDAAPGPGPASRPGGSWLQGAQEAPGPVPASVGERVMEAARDAAKSVFFSALLARLREGAPGVEQAMLQELLETKFSDTWQRHKQRAQGASAGPVVGACLVVAANQVAGPWLGRDPEQFRETLLLMLGGKTAAAFGFVHRLSLLLRRDKLAYVGTLMDRMGHDWGPAFTYERSGGPGRQQVRVTRCAYAEILEEEGAAHLTPIFCALERQWFDTLSLSRSKVAFQVPSRIADGAPSCLFEATQE